MPRKKDYRLPEKSFAPIAAAASASASNTQAEKGLLVFSDVLPPEARITRALSVDLREWVQRLEIWVDTVLRAYHAMLARGVSTESIVGYCRGAKSFMEFNTLSGAKPLVPIPSALRNVHVVQFANWLRATSKQQNWSGHTAHSLFAHFKATVKEMIRLKAVPGDISSLFPKRAFKPPPPDAGKQKAFSDAEISRLAIGIKQDIVDVHHQRLKLLPSENASNRCLVTMMRTGVNPTPIFEISRKSARPGLLPGSKVVSVKKERNKKKRDLALLGKPEQEEPLLIPTDAAAILDLMLRESEELVAKAPARIRDRVWLFRRYDSKKNIRITALSFATLKTGIESLVKRRRLLGDDGKPMRINATRLRKSFAKRAFRLSDGDVIATANLLGNEPKMADTVYLSVDDELKAEGAKYIGVEISIHMRGDGKLSSVIPIKREENSDRKSTETPVAGCGDTLNGEYAYKDGVNHCDKFVMCLFCPSFAIVGEANELWRLFSFQAFAESELRELDNLLPDEDQGDPLKQQLRRRYRLAIPFIDSFTKKHFGEQASMRAKARARLALHPFWASQLRLAKLRRQIVMPRSDPDGETV